MIAAGSSLDASSFGGPLGGTWPHANAAAADMQWGMYGYPNLCIPDTRTSSLAAGQPGMGSGGAYANGTDMSAQGQAAAQGHACIAKRKCGRPKAPNPLMDPNISEKRARRYVYSLKTTCTACLSQGC